MSTCTTRGNITTLRVSADEKRPPKLSQGDRVRAVRAKWVARGRCMNCGKPRRIDRRRGRTEPYHYRCIRCQNRERVRHRRKYGHNFATMKNYSSKEQALRQKRTKAFLRRLEKESNGANP